MRWWQISSNTPATAREFLSLLTMPPTLYLIDGHALAYRAFFALTRGTSSFTTRAGEPTAGVFGFTSILLRLLEHEKPEYLAVAFDTGKTFRDKLYPEYKATRAKMPSDLRPQIPRIRQLVDAFHIPRLEMEGYEADDLLGSVAHQTVAQGYGVKIITGDRDLLQLVDDRILVSLPGQSIAESKDYRSADVKEYLGVRPDQVVDYKALVGDKSDNIPGVAGIGEKTAITLLDKYGTLEKIYDHLDDLSENVRKKLVAGHENAALSRKLATIVTDLKVSFEVESARVGQFDSTVVEGIFRELEFNSMLGRLESMYKAYGIATSASAARGARGQQLSLFGADKEEPAGGEGAVSRSHADQTIQFRVVDTTASLEELVKRLLSAKIISIDTETTSTDPMRADLVGISLAVDDETGYYLPVGHEAPSGSQLSLKEITRQLAPALSDPHIPKAGHNIKYDYVVLARHGLAVTPMGFDSMIAEWLCNPGSRSLGLKGLAWARLGLKMTEIETLIGKGKEQCTMAQVSIADAAPYASADAVAVLRLMPMLQKDLSACQATKLLDEIEMPLIPVLAGMEMAGVSLDVEFLAGMSKELDVRMREIESLVHQAVGMPFNLNSTQQLSVALFDTLKLPPPSGTRRTVSGHYSTSAEVLEYLRGKHEVVDQVLEYRELAKLRSTYVDALPTEINPITGRVHTSYSQTQAVTGRLSSMDPNLQNIPIRSDLGRVVRQAFVAERGNVLLSVDYSQVELRIVAHMADDQAMLNAFRTGQDIHATTAAAVYGVPLEAVNKDQRRSAKAINFGLIYGMSAFGLTRTTDLTLAEAENFVEAYFRQFPGVKSYLDGVRRLAADQGYVETLLGRRRYFPGLKTQRDVNVRNREEREAINAPIQGTAADIMKLAMLRVPDALAKAGLQGRMLLQVHDELVLECSAKELVQTAKVVQKVMENAYSLKVPLETEARSGKNWGEMSPVGSHE
jgi:DNA polymerase I